MMRRTAALLAVLVLIGPAAGIGGAWDDTGHKVVALLAYRELGTNHQAVQVKIQKILKDHPHYDEYLAKDKPSDVTQEEWVVMRAATWADWARDKPEYHRPTWHYVNKPLLDVGKDDKETRLKIESHFSSRKENHGDILTAYPDCRRVLRNGEAKAEQRAIRLCWILHLVGDIHQPLHATAFCTREFPGGDAGGNTLYIRRPAGGRSLSLHSFWDNILDSGGRADIELITRDIQTNVKVTEKERQVSEIGLWAEESFELAHDYAYLPKGKRIEFVLDTNPADNHPPSGAPKLDKEYEEKALEVGRRRILLAGLRLADVLVADLKN